MIRTLKINPADNVTIVLEDGGDIPRGHKVALCDIPKGRDVIKYGYPIGKSTTDITAGSHVHTHNLKSALSVDAKYNYHPTITDFPSDKQNGTFSGYLRKNGKVGIRNEIWIVNTVGCVNKLSEQIAAEANRRFTGRTDGVVAVTHPYGCSQLGADHENTRKILAGMVLHPNAAGVLVLGLGCENNTIAEFKTLLASNPDYDESRIRFLLAQECADETETALDLIEELVTSAEGERRIQTDIGKLVVGLKCGGSDGFSGITANPLVGRFSDMLCAHGGTVVLTETPEMFGAETILMNRCKNQNLFNKTVDMVNGFKRFFSENGQTVYENPSPGNKDGGITTLEEKSLGCIQKGGTGIVTDVLEYGGRISTDAKGLVLLDGPGNDIVSVSALTAAGCHLVLFTTGRGTPIGAFSPTVKISTNTALYQKKPAWFDYNAGTLVSRKDLDEAARELFALVISAANGDIRTKSEISGRCEFGVFKTGVIL